MVPPLRSDVQRRRVQALARLYRGFSSIASASSHFRTLVRGLARLAASVLLFLPLFLGGCVSLVAPYDEVTDRTLQELAVRTEVAVARGDAGQLSVEEGTRILREGQGTVRALESRVALLSKSKQDKREIDTLGELGAAYKALADRKRPLRSSVAAGLRIKLLDAQQIQIAKKRSAVFSASLRQKNSTP